MTIRRVLILLLAAASAGAAPAPSTPFTCGSSNSDGALNPAPPSPPATSVTYDFDPTTLTDQCPNNVCNFTTINIPAGVTLNMRASKLREQSVVWLASGAVTIAGTLNLSGANGYPPGSQSNLRIPSEPGPGGYAGGVAADETSPNESGAGPGGELNGNGSYATGDKVYGNSMLVPLRGGSGGSGDGTLAGGGGAAGGGAIQIVSCASITISGSITANGGVGIGVGGTPNGNASGYTGSGGAIHLEAPTVTVTVTGSVYALGVGTLDTPYASDFGDGWIRIDSTSSSLTGQILPIPIAGPLFNVPLPTAVPTISITSIGGVTVPSAPTGSFTAPDVTINAGGSVPIAIAATNIPAGTVVTLIVSSETGTDQTVQASPLAAGTGASSTATANIVWPLGVSRVFIRATW